MNLLSNTIQEPSSITHISNGNFIEKNIVTLVLIRGSINLNFFIQNEQGQLEMKLQLKLFGQIRQIKNFCPQGGNKDLLVITSDSGNLTILEFFKKNEKIKHRIILNETYCKTGCRRISPGYFISTDLKGRAIFLAANEKNKIIYLTKIENKDEDVKLSSPLEANLRTMICFDLISLDVGYENPIFVGLECEYGDLNNPQSIINTGKIEKKLNYYEMDISLNNLVLQQSIKVSSNAQKLLFFPKFENNEYFILVSPNNLELFDYTGTHHGKFEIPQRIEFLNQKNENNLLCFTFFKHKNFIFYLAQNQYGDVFKIQIKEKKIQIEYLFTSKIFSEIVLLKSGYLFCGNENYDHYLYAIEQLDPIQERQEDNIYFPLDISEFQSIKLVQTIYNQQGLVDFVYCDLLGDEIGQFYCLQSGINGSRLIKQTKGIKFEEFANKEFPLKSDQLWCLNDIGKTSNDITDYIILGLQERIIQLKAGEKITQSNENLGLILNKKTLLIKQLFNNEIIIGYLQVTISNIRVIEENQKVNNIDSDGNIIYCEYTNQKLVIVTDNNTVIYYRQNLLDFIEVGRKKLEREPLCIKILEKDKNKVSNLLLAIGFTDSTLRIFSLEQENILMQLSVTVLLKEPECICNIENQLLTSLINGQLNQAVIDKQTGVLQNNQIFEFNKNKTVKLFLIEGNGLEGIIISGKNQVLFSKKDSKFQYQQLLLGDSDQIQSVSLYNKKQGQECLIFLTQQNQLKFIRKQNDDNFYREFLNLDFNARKIFVNPQTLSLVVIQSQQNSISKQQQQEYYEQLLIRIQQSKYNQKFELIDKNSLQYYGSSKNWQSKIQIINPSNLQEINSILFQNENYHIITAYICNFKEIKEESFLLVSVVKNHEIETGNYEQSLIITYGIEQTNKQFTYIHETNLDDICYSMQQFQGKVLLGIGGILRLYALGKKQLLLKSELKQKMRIINNIKVINDRIYITDATDSVHLIQYNEKNNQFSQLADDLLPRYVTAFEILDYNTSILSDKFGNISAQRLPQNSEQELTEDFMDYKFSWDQGCLNGAPVKFEEVTRYYFVNLITQIRECQLLRSNQRTLIYTDIEGKIGILIPIEFKNHLDFFIHLEILMREYKENILDRNHLVFRSYYGSSKGVIDFELCEQYHKLSKNNKKNLAQKMEITVEEIENMLLMISFSIF